MQQSHGNPEIAVSSGNCDYVPGKLEEKRFVVAFKLMLNTKTNEAHIELSAPEKGTKVYKMGELDPLVMDGEFCKLKNHGSDQSHYLRLPTAAETAKFQQYFGTLQASVAAHHQQIGVAASVTEATSIAESVDSAASAVGQRATPSAASLAGDSSTSNEGQLINMHDFEQVPNPQLPSLLTAAEHIVNLIDKVIAEYNLEDHLIDSVIKGIEDGAIEYWIQHGFMEGSDDSIKEHFVEVLRHMAQIKIKMNLRLLKQKNKAKEPVQRGHDMVEPTSRIQYSAADIKCLRSKAVVPTEWSTSQGLPISAAAVTRSRLRSIDKGAREPIPIHARAVDEDVVMADTSNLEVVSPVVRLPSPSVTSTSSKSTQCQRVEGLSSSKWATAGTTTASKTPLRTPSVASSVGSPAMSKTARPSVRRAGSSSSSIRQGLSDSRYATKTVAFHGNFTGSE